MTKVYSESDLTAVKKQKKICLAVFFTVSALYLAAAVAVLVVYILEPYGSTRLVWLRWSVLIATALYAVFAYLFMSIRFNRVKRYAKFVGLALKRTPTPGVATFMRFNSDISVKDGVDFRSMTLVEWSEKEKDYMERYILLDVEKPQPAFRAGDELSFMTYSNALTAYEITNRNTLADTPFDQAEKGDSNV